MNGRRLAIAGFVSAGMILLAFGAQVSQRPSEDLQVAAAHLGGTPLRVRMTTLAGVGIDGAMDIAHHRINVSLVAGEAASLSVRQIDMDCYVMANGAFAPSGQAPDGRWMHLDLASLPARTRLQLTGAGPGQLGTMFTTAANVTKVGPREYTGSLDFTRASMYRMSFGPISLALVAPPDEVAADLHRNAVSVPFTATTDDHHRLTGVVIDVGAVADGLDKVTLRYSDIGVPVDVQRPPASMVVPMPAAFQHQIGL
ncbi:hypothetical protein HH310_05335 [Actinoplanes sp. TBRC 11911]|uniref:hypothetical protein n=1 Tax=Actinoplanes sp. TBRC 11911 TaxID=2729386 RepID=UPI00145D8203|nr:hypothetical protein [Actinoplanes sp. TBRC 11911]NMO50616.1 hypothetical protein [Actinoplanes sp. TBRC 11911]